MPNSDKKSTITIFIVEISQSFLLQNDGVLLICKKVNHITKCTCGSFVQFRIPTLGTGDDHKLFVLDIKYFCQSTTSGSHFIYFIMFIVAFWTDVYSFFHSPSLSPPKGRK